jgi:hypothetical protein
VHIGAVTAVASDIGVVGFSHAVVVGLVPAWRLGSWCWCVSLVLRVVITYTVHQCSIYVRAC